MLKKVGLWISGIAVIALQSCSVNTEKTYYKDSSTSMESNILIDKGMLSMVNMMDNGSDKMKAALFQNSPPIGKVYTTFKKTDWLPSTKILRKSCRKCL